jgi:hypothetical protein
MNNVFGMIHPLRIHASLHNICLQFEEGGMWGRGRGRGRFFGLRSEKDPNFLREKFAALATVATVCCSMLHNTLKCEAGWKLNASIFCHFVGLLKD